jgi:hypothetical protein
VPLVVSSLHLGWLAPWVACALGGLRLGSLSPWVAFTLGGLRLGSLAPWVTCALDRQRHSNFSFVLELPVTEGASVHLLCHEATKKLAVTMTENR